MIKTIPLTTADVVEILAQIPTRPDYETWTRIVSAVGSVLPEHEAADVLHAWSPEERQGEYLQKLRHRLNRVTIGSLIALAKQHGFDASAFHQHRMRGDLMPSQRTSKPAPIPTPPPPTPVVFKGMPEAERRIYEEGIFHLLNHPGLCAKVDSWRGYQPGTVKELAESRLMSAPLLRGQRALAFSVVTPTGIEAGFHARHRPRDAQRAPWSYHPTGTPALPFTIGGGYASNARRVLVFEGQWDAIALASALGWLAYERAWDEHTVFLGARGAGSVAPLLAHWMPLIPPSATWFVFRDTDKAGDAWGGFAAKIKAQGRKVRLHRPAAGKDVNDILRNRTVTPLEVMQ